MHPIVPVTFFMLFVVLVPSLGECRGAVVALDSKLVSEIKSGHKRLENSIARLSGTVTSWRGDLVQGDKDYFSTKGLVENLRARFYLLEDSVRIDHQRTQLEKKEKNIAYSEDDDFAEVLIQTPQEGLRYTAVSTTGIPYATLFVYEDPKQTEIDMRLKADLIYPASVLFEIAGTRVLDYLQLPNITLETRPYDSIDKALYILGKDIADSGQVTTFQIVLEPSRDYAVRSYDFRSKFQEGEIFIEGHVRIAEAVNGSSIPSVIATRAKSMQDGALLSASSYHEIVKLDVDSEERPDKQLFTVESFAALRRDYTLVNVSSNDSMVVGKTIKAAPKASRFPGGHSDLSGRSYFWILVNGIVIFCLGVLLVFRRFILSKQS